VAKLTGRQEDPPELEATLRASRPEPRPELVSRLSAEISRSGESRRRPARSVRLAPLLGFAVLVLLAFGAFGGAAIAVNGSDGDSAAEQGALADRAPARAAGEQYDEDVVLCHKPNGPSPQTLTLPPNAVDAHLAHGDTLGPCEQGGVAGGVASGGNGGGSGVAGAIGSGGALPFTGLNLMLVVVGGVALLAAGLVLRRGVRSPGP